MPLHAWWRILPPRVSAGTVPSSQPVHLTLRGQLTQVPIVGEFKPAAQLVYDVWPEGSSISGEDMRSAFLKALPTMQASWFMHNCYYA